MNELLNFMEHRLMKLSWFISYPERCCLRLSFEKFALPALEKQQKTSLIWLTQD